jgi:hypothetical protein
VSKGRAILLTSVVWWTGSIIYACYFIVHAARDPLTGDGYEREYWFLTLMFSIFGFPLLLVGYLVLICVELILLDLYQDRGTARNPANL